MSEILLAIYVAGVAIGLIVMRDRWSVRLATAVAWPLGIIAMIVVTIILLAAATYLWPRLMLTAWAAVAAITYGVWRAYNGAAD